MTERAQRVKAWDEPRLPVVALGSIPQIYRCDCFILVAGRLLQEVPRNEDSARQRVGAKMESSNERSP